MHAALSTPTPTPVSSPIRGRLRAAALVLAVSAAVVGSSTAVAAADTGSTTATAAAPAGRYYAITPTRALDTRASGGPIANNTSRVIDLSRAFGGASAAAAVINLTVTLPSSGGYLTAYPAGTTKPVASSLNFSPNQTRANSVTVALGQGAGKQNQLAIFAAVAGNGRAHVVVDVLGYYGNGGGAAGTSYSQLAAPVRLFDTRTSIGGLTTTYPKNIGIVTLNYQTPAINKTISAVVMNITVTGTRGAGNLTIWNGFGAPPLVSTLNFNRGETVANFAVIPVRCTDAACSKLTFSIKNNLSPYTQVLGDISGAYMTPSSSGLLYRSVAPTRVTDTREQMGFGSLGPALSGMSNVSRMMSSDVRALNVNLTAVKPTISTYLTVFPAGVARPLASNINLGRGQVAANAAQVKVSSLGTFMTWNAAGRVDIVVDVQGLFVLDPVGASKTASTDGAAQVNGAVS
ncbi:hypothetical protein ACXR2U_15960 [Jatrophihabitans sp. YIM 134969]